MAPAFARFLQVRYTGLKRHLDHYLHTYNDATTTDDTPPDAAPSTSSTCPKMEPR